nr:hypothetical protein [Tanacetum cinerariifolium]
MDDTTHDEGEDTVHDDDQPQDSSTPKKDKKNRQDWFTQALRPPTSDPEWNKHQAVTDQPEQPWFKEIDSAAKDPISFNDLMATPIDFSKFVLNRIKINNLTQDILLGPAFNLLKEDFQCGLCKSREITWLWYLEEIVVKRADRQLYKFKEGDFVDLHLNDIEDMLLLAVQHILFHLNDKDTVDFIVAL